MLDSRMDSIQTQRESCHVALGLENGGREGPTHMKNRGERKLVRKRAHKTFVTIHECRIIGSKTPSREFAYQLESPPMDGEDFLPFGNWDNSAVMGRHHDAEVKC